MKHIILPETIRVCPVSSAPGECPLNTKLADAATEPVQRLCDAKIASAPLDLGARRGCDKPACE